eukprot:1869308-Rhodomonas_salina.1
MNDHQYLQINIRTASQPTPLTFADAHRCQTLRDQIEAKRTPLTDLQKPDGGGFGSPAAVVAQKLRTGRSVTQIKGHGQHCEEPRPLAKRQNQSRSKSKSTLCTEAAGKSD